MITCSKEYRDIPFGHRQPNHDGHCALIHGHNWGVKFSFAAKTLDRSGFVVDFGKLKGIKDMLNEFDHALVLNETDPYATHLMAILGDHNARLAIGGSHFANAYQDAFYGYDGMQGDGPSEKPLANIKLIPDCSCEGIARYWFHKADKIVRDMTNGRAYVVLCEVFEDEKNSASYSG